MDPATKVDANRYPAGHFVGMAGVGDDAAQLPLAHPRAGIFGVDRRTKLTDIKDGTSNTILVAGVREKIGAWAGGGNATVRSLNREPYVNGPDGFGTGQPDGMLVLMADGSVRFVSKQTDPRVLRRMAAMADGLDLALKLPGEPGQPGGGRSRRNDRSLSQNGNPKQSPPRPRPAKPVEAPKPPANGSAAPEPAQRIDVAQALSQPILRFEQVRPVSFRMLLIQVEEMAGVPIRFDERELGNADAIWKKPVSLKLTDTSVGKILEALLEHVGLKYEIQSDGLRLYKTPTGSKHGKS